MAEPLGPARGMAAASGSGQHYPIVRGTMRSESKPKQTEAVPSVSGALVYYTVRPL